jgi:hypothetical protein
MVTRLRAGRQGLDPDRGSERIFIFFPYPASRPVVGPTHPPFKRIPGALSSERKRLGLKDDHFPPSGTEIKNAWSYTSTPPSVYMAWYLIKHGDFALPFNLWSVISY